jgi:RecA-family ATPase
MRTDDMYAINAADIERLVKALFPYAEEGTFLVYCALHEFEKRGRVLGEAGRVSGDLDDIVRRAAKIAEDAANHAEPLVFCPPIATFGFPDGASTADLANGLAISVDIDKADPDAARERLEGLLGPATVVVESGSEWVDPETGEVRKKKHLHWRLSEATKTAEEHEKLREARWLAATLVGADMKVAPVVHPLRWPGSWNKKDKPTQASIVACDSAREVHLDLALEALSDAVALAGVEAAGGARAVSGGAVRDPRVAAKSQPPLALVVDALRHLPNPYDESVDLREQRTRVAYALYATTAGSDAGRQAWCEWNAKRADYDQAKVVERWESVRRSPPRVITGWTITHLAREHAGWTAPTPEPPPDPDGCFDGVRDADFGRAAEPRKGAERDRAPDERPREAPSDDKSAPLAWVNVKALAAKPVVKTRWVVEGWLPVGHVTSLYGDGGMGKTLLAQQLMTACATGALWCGMRVTRCRAIGLFAEDSEDELHARQDRLNRGLGVGYGDLGDMNIASGFGRDVTLARFDPRGKIEPTGVYTQVLEAARDFGARLVVLDTAADLFGGDENSRQHVRQFVRLLGRIAIEIGGAVLLTAHPSRDGLKTGRLDGASTAWHNSVRSRWTLERDKGKSEDEGDPNARVLSLPKSNYGRSGDTLRLRWEEGVFHPTEASLRPAADRARDARQRFLELVDLANKNGTEISGSVHSPNYAPKVFAKRRDKGEFTKDDFVKALEALKEDGLVKTDQVTRDRGQLVLNKAKGIELSTGWGMDISR